MRERWLRSRTALLLKAIRRLTSYWLSKARDAREERCLLEFWLKAEIQLASQVTPQSESGRRALKFWFDLQRFTERQINVVCNQYYDGKHPKHYLWQGHNQYLYDGVKEGERVLDIGCGSSYYQQWIAEKAVEVVAVDIRPDRVELSWRNNQKPNVRFKVMDVTRELPEGQFDVAICSHVLEHLGDPITMLNSLATKVPRLLVKVPLVDAHWMKLVKRDIGMFWMDDADHRREYTEDLLREELEASGWQVTEMIRGYDLRATAISTYLSDDEGAV